MSNQSERPPVDPACSAAAQSPSARGLPTDQTPTEVFEAVPAEGPRTEAQRATLHLTRKRRGVPAWIPRPRPPALPAWHASAAAAGVLLVCAVLVLAASRAGHSAWFASSPPRTGARHTARAPHGGRPSRPHARKIHPDAQRRAPRPPHPKRNARYPAALPAPASPPAAASAQRTGSAPQEEPPASTATSERQTPGGPFSP
jgi:hypothetical protein